MNRRRIQALVAFLLMALAFGAAQALRPTLHMADLRGRLELETVFPKQFGDWTIDNRVAVQLISPVLQAVIDRIYNQTLSRTYVNPKGQRMMLSVAYGGDQSDATRAHRPGGLLPRAGLPDRPEQHRQREGGRARCPGSEARGQCWRGASSRSPTG